MSDAAAKQDRSLLRAEVAQAIADYIADNLPPEKLRPTIVARFPMLPRATIYVWIKQALESGAIGKTLAARTLKVHSLAEMPEVHSLAQIQLAAAVNEALHAIQDVLRYARGDDPGKPRNPKLTLSSALALTRTAELTMGLHQALVAAHRMESFNRALIQEIQKESPDLAQRVTDRLRALMSRIEV